MHIQRYLYPLCLLIMAPALLFGQAVPMQSWSTGEIKNALKKAQVVGSVLYMAAHPDDENTRFIAYAAKGKGLRTAYLSLTRGDGGQNLIGKEVRELLGIIRTQELLAARRLDGGEQFFSRANDFGYSKHPDETLEIWNEEQVLSDAVWVIRKFRPDIIVTRFSPDRAGRTHGHHTTSALMALKAAKAAADPNQFPEQLKHVEVWAPKRVVWNTSWWFFRGQGEEFDASKYMQVDIGEYNPLLGSSYNEIASHSRTMHKSQGFGSSISRGSTIEYFQHLYGDSSTNNSLFQNIDMSWNRIKGGKKVAEHLKKAEEAFNPDQPSEIVPMLLEAYQELEKLAKQQPENPWIQYKRNELSQLILQSEGIWASATTDEYYISPGDSVSVKLSFLRRGGNHSIALKGFSLQNGSATEQASPQLLEEKEVLKFNEMQEVSLSFAADQSLTTSQHYWLTEEPSKGMFKVGDQLLRGLPENPWTFPVTLTFSIGETTQELSINIPTLYRWTDPVDGERHRPIEITPPVTANIEQTNYIFASEQAKTVQVRVKAFKESLSAQVSLCIPQNWKAEPSSIDCRFEKKGEEQVLSFQVYPPKDASEGLVSPLVKVGEESYEYGLVTINYPHIPIQTLFPKSKAQVVRLDIKKRGERVGYIMGAGDAIPEALEQIGYQVDILEEADVTPDNLKQYDAVIAGVRAYNTIDRMGFLHQALMQYVQEGGNYIVQYNTNRGLKSDEVGPYPLKISRDRITVEEASVKIIDPNHPLMQGPNKITEADFEGWVQERGLYFPNEWDEQYTPILSSKDPQEEKELQGGLLVANYGKGTFIYTGYSWFRELPAGVSGAYRLFVNLISYEQQAAKLQSGD